MTKSELRKKYKFLRQELTTDDIDQKSISIANSLLDLDIWTYSFYHLYLSITQQKEVNTHFLLNILQGKDKNIVVSKSDFESLKMFNYLLTDDTVIKENDWGIPEPENGIEITISKIEVVFVPLLAFDKNGNRVGYGKGFYDLFLQQCQSNTLKIGLSFFEAEETIEDMSENDINLDYCVTPISVYDFTT